MLFLLFNLLQSQTRLPKVVIAVAVLVLIAGVSLLVYFYRRYKRTEKEPEEDWEISRSSLFVNVTAAGQKTEQVASKASEASLPASEIPSAEIGGTREFASESELRPPAAEATQPPRVETAPTQEVASPEPRVESVEPRLTELLASPSREAVAESKAEPAAVDAEPAVFDHEVLTGLKASEHPPITHEPPPIAREHRADPVPPPPVARVDQQSHREPFEPPRVERILHREPFEPPRIEPLAPREQEAATREMHSPLLPETQANKERNETLPFSSASAGAPPAALPGEPARGSRELEAEWSSVSSARMPEPSVAGKAYRAPAGSVLGIPAELSNKPLILGDPVRPANETGIGALSNYGKDVNPAGSRGGTIALLVVVLLVGGALALYFFVPSIHARVNDWVTNVRGTRTSGTPPLRAQVIPSYKPKVNKNMVTWEVPVDNISNEPIENLSVEISLLRAGDAPPEIRTASVTPNPLPPGQRGTFEFEYDGKRETGFIGYKITRLFSNGAEIRFSTPGK